MFEVELINYFFKCLNVLYFFFCSSKNKLHGIVFKRGLVKDYFFVFSRKYVPFSFVIGFKLFFLLSLILEVFELVEVGT